MSANSCASRHRLRSGVRDGLTALCLILLVMLWPCKLAGAQASSLQANLSETQKLWVSQHPEIEYAAEADYGPFIYLDQQGEVKGLSVDVLNLVAAKTGLKFKAGPASNLASILALAQQQKLSMITSLRATPERSAYLNFSMPYASIPAVLALPEKQALKQLSELSGKRIAVGKGYAVEHYVRTTYPEINWHSVPDDNSALKALQLGEVDGVVADLASLIFLRNHPDSPKFVIAGKLGFTYELSFAFNKNQSELAAIVQAGLLAITPAERDLLLSKWMPAEQSINPLDYRALFIILLSLILASWFAYRYFRQRRKIAETLS